MKQEDLESFSERESLQYIGLEFLPRPDGSAVSPHEVTEYLRARGIIAGVSDGPRFGTTLPVVANLAVLSDDSIAIAATSESYGHGQNADEFLPGLSYSLNSSIVMNEEVIFLPSGEVEDYDPEDLPAGLDRSIHLCNSDDPTPAYLSLLEVESAGSYGYVNGKLFFSPPQGYLAIPAVTALSSSSHPMLTFTRAGDSLWASIALTDTGENDVVVRWGPDYDSTLAPSTVPTSGSELEYLVAWVTRLPCYSTSELFDALSAPDAPQKLVRRFRAPHLKAAMDLRQMAEQLSEMPRKEFFPSAAQAMDLGTEEVAILAEFESAPIDKTFAWLGGQKMTRVEPREKVSLLKSSAQGVAISSIHDTAKLDSTRRSRSLRVRAHRSDLVQTLLVVAPVVAVIAVGVGLIGSLISTQWAAALDLVSTSDWVVFWALFGALLLGAIFALSQRPGLNRARTLLRRAREDGVYPYDL